MQSTSPSNWTLEIVYGIANSEEMTLSQKARREFTLVVPTTKPTTINESETTQLIQATQTTTEYVYLYASVAILITALVSVVIGCSVIGVMIWIARVRSGLRKKIKDMADQQKNSVVRKHSSILNSTRDAQRRSNNSTPEICLRRTESTIGFPTAEKHKRQRQRKKRPTKETERDASSDTANGCSTNVPSRSHSLPNLSVHAVQSTIEQSIFPEPPRRSNLNQVHTRVQFQKLANTERSSLNRLMQQQLKANKDAENLRIVQEIATKRRNYGVNEGKHNSNKQKGRNILASYAVRSLAASAKTPEPGSRPSTEL